MNKLFRKVTSFVLAFAVMLTCIPLSAFAACNHTANIRYDISESSHTKVCADCNKPLESTVHHTNNSNGNCPDCGATVDADNEHHHDVGNNPWIAIDGMEHEAHCADCSMMLKGPHGDNVSNPDGLCDMCGYGTPICQVHTHKVVNGEYQYEIGPAGHRPICGNCDQPYDGEAHCDNDSDNICDVCGFSISCYHTNMGRWWDTAETEHTHHCVCGYPVSPAASHTDALQNSDGTAGADNLCDVCGVGVDNLLKHTHVWSTAWSQNNDNTEHFQDCTDTSCTVSTNVHSALDADSSGRCDRCDLPMGNQGGQSCTHTPRQNQDGSYVYIVGEEEHYNVCDNCNTTYTTGISHTDTDNDGSCDKCHAPVVLTNGKYRHTHTLNPNGPFAVSPVHYDRCDTCGSDLNETAHTDSDSDNFCDGCGTTVTKDSDGAYRHYCANSTPKAMDEYSHAEICPNCVQKNNWENHSDTDSDNKCDKCSATLNANNIHIHQPDGNWTPYGPNHTCECTECEEWVNEPHTDNNTDDICDQCNETLSNGGNQGSGTSCTHSRYLWWDTAEKTHQQHCGDCGNAVDFIASHEDNDNNKKCDVCGVGIDTNGIHTHVWSSQWATTGATSHFHDCTDSACTVSTDSIAHADNDGDAECDTCGRAKDSEWCVGHQHNGRYSGIGDKHYTMCSNCGSAFGNGTAHVQEKDAWFSEQNVHRPVCEMCMSAYGNGDAHVNTDNDDECDVCGLYNLNGGTVHTHVQLKWNISEEEHARSYECCSVEFNRAYHIDENADGTCDDCNASVKHDTFSHRYVHEHVKGSYRIDRYDHIAECTDCGCIVIWEGHFDQDSNDICDECGTKLTIDNEGNLVHDHTISAWIDCGDNSHHMKECTVCGEQDIEMANHVDALMDGTCDECNATLNHSPSADYRVSANGHVKYCVNCDLIYPTEEPHRDSEKDGYCDLCYVDVDSNAKHVHTIPSYMTADRNEHYKECPNCRLVIPGTSAVHTDANSDTMCDGCNAVLNAANEHFHSETTVYLNNLVHENYCKDCDTIFGTAEHWDENNDSTCDQCNTSFIKVDVGLTSAGTLLNRFKDAMSKAVNNNDYSDLEVFFEHSQAVDFTEIYKEIISRESTADLRIVLNTFVALEKDCATDADIKSLFDSAKTVLGNKLTIDKIFSMDILAEVFHGNGATGSSCAELNNKELLDYVLNFNAGDVKANRIWYVYASNDGGVTYTKVAETAKGASSISFKYERFYDIFVLAYEDVATSNQSSGGSSSTDKTEKEEPKDNSSSKPVETLPAPSQPTQNGPAKPATKPSAPTKPETGNEPALPAMPENADTTVIEIVASEEVVEAVKETVVVNEGTANIDENAMEAVVEATVGDEPVILPLTQVSEETVEKAIVDTKALETVAEAKKEVAIEFSDMTVKFDAKALKAITDQADGGTIEIRAVKAEEQHLSEEQKNGLDKKDVAAVVSVQIFSNGEYIGNFKGGKVTIKIPFQPEEGREGKHHTVYYVDDHGKTKKVPSEFINGHMVFTTSHFSDYIIVYEVAEAVENVQSEEVILDETPVEDGIEAEKASFPVVPVIAIVGIIAVVAVILIMKKRCAEE